MYDPELDIGKTLLGPLGGCRRLLRVSAGRAHFVSGSAPGRMGARATVTAAAWLKWRQRAVEVDDAEVRDGDA